VAGHEWLVNCLRRSSVWDCASAADSFGEAIQIAPHGSIQLLGLDAV
jgi:hypothetical protein